MFLRKQEWLFLYLVLPVFKLHWTLSVFSFEDAFIYVFRTATDTLMAARFRPELLFWGMQQHSSVEITATLGILKPRNPRRLFPSLFPEDCSTVLQQLQPLTLARDRTAARDLVMIFIPCFWSLLPYKRSNQLSCNRAGLYITAVFSTSKHFTSIKWCIVTAHLQRTVDRFYLDVIVVFSQTNRKQFSHQLFIFWPSG